MIEVVNILEGQAEGLHFTLVCTGETVKVSEPD